MSESTDFFYGIDPLARFWERQRRRRLFISFSGGKTSAYMTVLLLTEYRHLWEEVVVIFANTGQEDEKTLEYVRDFSAHYKIPVVWVEAVVDPKPRRATTHRVVTFETASRKGEPFERVIEKYGLPNTQFPHCTRELKERPMWSYLDSLGWDFTNCETAIGLRADEIDRISPSWMARGVFYPLVDLRRVKADVLGWELAQPVRLGIPEHFGNCRWCWKKSFRKLGTVTLEEPTAFDFPARMELIHKDSGAGDGDRRFFRGRKTTADIFTLARDPGFEPFVDGFPWKDEELDTGMSCGEGCDIGTDGPNEVAA